MASPNEFRSDNSRDQTRPPRTRPSDGAMASVLLDAVRREFNADSITASKWIAEYVAVLAGRVVKEMPFHSALPPSRQRTELARNSGVE